MKLQDNVPGDLRCWGRKYRCNKHKNDGYRKPDPREFVRI